MRIFIVTSKTTEKSPAGVILKVMTRTWGVFSDGSHASEIADKHGALVQEVDLDAERDGLVLQEWVNPGVGG